MEMMTRLQAAEQLDAAGAALVGGARIIKPSTAKDMLRRWRRQAQGPVHARSAGPGDLRGMGIGFKVVNRGR